jgi:hypothetical protein
MIEIRPLFVPRGLLSALDKWRGKYTDPKFLYQSVWIDGDVFAGVFGDGPNGAYEWFVWEEGKGKLRTSDNGYGSDCGALLDALIESGAGDWARDKSAAAPPELLAALKLAEDAMTRGDFGAITLLPVLRDAIAKAEGR